jgi:hypothetical protein
MRLQMTRGSVPLSHEDRAVLRHRLERLGEYATDLREYPLDLVLQLSEQRGRITARLRLLMQEHELLVRETEERRVGLLLERTFDDLERELDRIRAAVRAAVADRLARDDDAVCDDDVDSALAHVLERGFGLLRRKPQHWSLQRWLEFVARHEAAPRFV